MIHSITKPIQDHHCRQTGKTEKWYLNSSNNKCYLIGKKSILNGISVNGNYSQANQYCKDVDAQLAAVHSFGFSIDFTKR